MTMIELLPPGVYPVWSRYDSDEAAAVLIKALTENKPCLREEIKEENYENKNC